jgi:predicted lipoprotein with Yx(FWY)xxD motif
VEVIIAPPEAPMARIRTSALLTVSALAVTLMSACGGSSGTQSTAAPPPVTNDGQSSGIRLVAKQINKLGQVITDSRGMTLYRFDRDTSNPPESNCYGPCVGLWPPVTGTADQVQTVGIDKALIGTVTRKDGITQLCIDGWPLYHYAKDAAPGEAKGQAVGNTWYAATPKGGRAAATEDSGYGSGY